MTGYRIQILFSGDAPDDELERARILGAEDVAEAVLHLSKALEAHGFSHTVQAQTIRRIPKRPRQPRVVGGQAAE